jgi:hypothetical protein
LNFLQLETSKKGCQANLGWSIGGPPKVQFACSEPPLDLSSRNRFRETFVIECDHVDFCATTRTPGQNRSCASKDQQRLRLNSDPGYFRRHGLLHFVNLGCIPSSDVRMLREWRIKSP